MRLYLLYQFIRFSLKLQVQLNPYLNLCREYVILDIRKGICYNRCLSNGQCPAPKVDAPKHWFNVLKNPAQPVCRQVRHFLFSLILPIYVGKQRYQQSSGRYQQSQYSQKNHNSFIICHQRHLPSGISPVNRRLHRLPLQ